jgi:hypothetical protein
MNKPIRTTTPAGEAIVILPADEYERLVEAAEDARDIAAFDRAWAEFEERGGDVLTDAEMRTLLRARSPVGFWRKRRKLTRAVLAASAGITEDRLAQLEKGARVRDIEVYRGLATALGLDIEEVLPPLPAKPTRRRKSA